MEEEEKNFFGGIPSIFTVNKNNNNNNSNNSNNSNNKSKNSLPLNTIGQNYGFRDLPSNVKVFEVQFDMKILKQIDEETKPVISSVIHHISYEIAESSKDIAIHIYVSKDLKDVDNVNYLVYATFLKNVEFDISDIVRQLRLYAPLKIRDNIKIRFNEENQAILQVPVNKLPLKTVKVTQILLHYHDPLPDYTYDSLEERGITKRKRGNNDG